LALDSPNKIASRLERTLYPLEDMDPVVQRQLISDHILIKKVKDSFRPAISTINETLLVEEQS
jgi:hypothetical protein